MAIKEGKAAPFFTLTDQNNNEVALQALQGKHVIVYFYPKDDTPGCTKEACSFRDLWSAIEATGAVVLGISPDDADSHQRFIQKYSLPLTLLSDPDKKVMSEYGAFGEKVMYGKKSIGIIRSTVWIDPEGTVKKHWRKVPNAEKHPASILALLQKEVD